MARDELPAIREAWLAFIAAHRAALQAGETFPIDGPASSPSLVPRTFRCTLASGATWPPAW